MAAAKWILSNKGAQLWENAISSVYIIDPKCQVNFDHLYQMLLCDSESHGWIEDDLRFRPSDDENQGNGMIWNILPGFVSQLSMLYPATMKKIFLIRDIAQIQGFRGKNVISFSKARFRLNCKISFLHL